MTSSVGACLTTESWPNLTALSMNTSTAGRLALSDLQHRPPGTATMASAAAAANAATATAAAASGRAEQAAAAGVWGEGRAAAGKGRGALLGTSNGSRATMLLQRCTTALGEECFQKVHDYLSRVRATGKQIICFMGPKLLCNPSFVVSPPGCLSLPPGFCSRTKLVHLLKAALEIRQDMNVISMCGRC